MQYDKNATVVDQFGTCIPERQNRKMQGICSTYIAGNDKIQQQDLGPTSSKLFPIYLNTATDCKQYSRISKKYTSRVQNNQRNV